MLTLDLVTPANYEESLALKVSEDQEHLIAPMVNSLADAFVWKAEPRVAIEEGRLVGFVMVFPFTLDDTPVVNIVRFLIDAGHQSRGLGRQLMGATIDLIGSLEPRPVRVRISTFPENERALSLYRSTGFEGSDIEAGEVVLWRDVAPA